MERNINGAFSAICEDTVVKSQNSRRVHMPADERLYDLPDII